MAKQYYDSESTVLPNNVVYVHEMKTHGKIHLDSSERTRLQPVYKDVLSILTLGRLTTQGFKELIELGRINGAETPELITRIPFMFSPYQPFLKLRSFSTFTTKRKMHKVLRVATSILDNPAFNEGNARAHFRFMIKNSNGQVDLIDATWDAEQQWFKLRTGQMLPLFRENQSLWENPNY